MLIFKCVLVVVIINSLEVHVHAQLDLLLIFALVSVLNGLDCMCALNDMHAAESLA